VSTAKAPRVTLILARARNGVIGAKGGLPWHLPEDLVFFKRTTMGHPIVMGRKTWESIGRPLPGRLNIVITRQAGMAAPGCTVVGSFDEALEVSRPAEEICVIGGAEVYRLALPRAQVIHRTQVHATVAADTYFPALDAAAWEEVARQDHPADDRHVFSYSFLELRRRA
jgi:dihydrofolate reductase